MRRFIVTLAIVVAAWGQAAPAMASSGTWPWPVQGAIALPYGAAWTDASGRSCTHGGVDIAAQPGSRVMASAAGVVAFCGQVPAAGGGTALAVSVDTPDGLRTTYLPLVSSALRQGAAVGAGDAVGTLAGAGDGSSPDSHLHLSVKRGGASLDPAAFLEEPVAATAGPAASAAPSPPAGADVPAPTAAIPRRPVGVPVDGYASVAAPGPAPLGVPVASPAAAAQPAGAEALARALRSRSLPATGVFTARIAPLPVAPRLDAGRVAAALRGWLAAGGGLAARFLLALLAAVVAVPAVRALSRASAGARAVPVPAGRRRDAA